MSATDPIADMLTRMRNAALMRRREVQIPASKLRTEIARILKEEGFIRNYKVIKDGPQGILAVTLKYTEGNQSVLAGARRISKPGCRVYCTKDTIPKVYNGLGLAVISTSKGILTGAKCEELGLGGEVLCTVW
ncbi:MAG: 30S ribosomal protein S8 [Acidobacteriota bacterium]|jgi:small subunit ribosomal protein S8|nr:30S ribosomal protein S8 [Acidobacteriota bacterium]OQB56046.1 MAG: 30S ribosomal protein S8 [Candidatus Aminicenantes bacterium ADurb.Bin147]HNQ79532.1 30S ribosomal protein S8 [Candidatus Aminicenantes bacterium]MDD8010120.1 30S ribosomal protein S8 [Acidobacteriota bacterium]MDD8029739.1 30S ribosomal protein S8 [Acidobacteriota bacterium]